MAVPEKWSPPQLAAATEPGLRLPSIFDFDSVREAARP